MRLIISQISLIIDEFCHCWRYQFSLYCFGTLQQLEFKKLENMAASVQQKHDCDDNVEISFENVKKVKLSGI